MDLQGLDANPSDNIEGSEESNAEEISNGRKKNLALSVEEVKELAARLFSGNFDYTETEKGVYKGYWLRDIGSRVTKSIIDEVGVRTYSWINNLKLSKNMSAPPTLIDTLHPRQKPGIFFNQSLF